jgi:hypothetical protein
MTKLANHTPIAYFYQKFLILLKTLETSGYKLMGISFPTLLFITMLASFLLVNFNGPSHIRERIIDGDGSGYYAYLLTLIINKTVDFTSTFEFEKQKRSREYQGHYFHKAGDILVNKYTSGTALLQLPFFLLAYILSLIIGLPADGHNLLFHYGVAAAAFFYVFIGLLFFKKLADLYGVSNKVSIPLAFALLFGTNLFHSTFLVPSMSHAYSFSLVSIFLYFLKRVFVNYNSGYVFVSAFLLGLIVLVRPVNILIVSAIPFIASSNKALVSTIRKKVISKDVFISIALFLLALSPQIIINYLQIGKLFTYGYENEGFYWHNPEVLNFLLSYRKGWLVYTPFMLLIIPSIIHLYKRSRYEFFTFTFFLVLVIYVFSSWWNWIYGDSFGMRPMVDFYAILLLVICLFADSVRKKWVKIAIVVFSLMSIFFNLFQSWQYNTGILHSDSMNKQAYWHVFLRTGDQYIGSIGDHDEYFYGELSEVPFHSSLFLMSKDVPEGWTGPKDIDVSDPNNMKAILNDKIIYSPTYHYPIPDSIIGMKNIYVEFYAKYAEEDDNAALGANFVVDISDENEQLLFYKTFRLKRLPDDVTSKWRDGSIGFKLPEITPKMDRIKLYIWNGDKQKIFIERMDVRFYTYGRGEG